MQGIGKAGQDLSSDEISPFLLFGLVCFWRNKASLDPLHDWRSANGTILHSLLFMKHIATLEELVITELALSAMDELIQMAQLKERLWVSSMDHNTVVLDKQEYVRFFSRATIAATNLKGYKIEAGMLQEVTSVVY
nr:homeobox-leucine zipper protein HDG2 isoform X1 [Ipomoea batatas]